MIVQDIMTADPLTVSETTSIGEVLGTFAEEGIRHLPVTRSGDVVGIVSDRDLSSLGFAMVNDLAGYDQVRARLSQPISALMTGGVVTIDQDSDVSEAVDLLVEEKLSALPVVESGTSSLVGIISYIDVLKAVSGALEGL